MSVGLPNPRGARPRGLGAMSFERQVLLSAWLVAVPALLVACWMVWRHGANDAMTWTGIAIVLGVTALLAARL